MPKYENGIIYKLKHYLDYDDLNIYIGSTCNFKHRKNGHKTACNNEKSRNYNMKVYQFIRDNGGWDQFIMIAIEQYSCNNKKELETRERYHIDLLRPTLNKIIPTRTIKEYYDVNKENFKEYYENNKEKIAEKTKERYENNKEKNLEKAKEYRNDNKEKIAEIHKKWREANKEKIAERKKNYYESNKEKIAERKKKWREDNNEKLKERKKIYYESNKEKVLESSKKWREANKEKFNEQRKEYREANKEYFKEYLKKYRENNKEKVICDFCGCELKKNNLKNHQKTKKCLKSQEQDITL